MKTEMVGIKKIFDVGQSWNGKIILFQKQK